jgi:hypothetical protein
VQDLEIDHVQALLQSKVRDVERQGEEFAGMVASNTAKTVRLAAQADEQRALNRRIAGLQADVAAARRAMHCAQLAANDSARQVTELYVALYEARGLQPPPRGQVPYPENMNGAKTGLQDAQQLITEQFKEPADLDGVLAMAAQLRAALRAVAADAEAKAQERERDVADRLQPRMEVCCRGQGDFGVT